MQLTLFKGHLASCFTPQEAYFLGFVVSKEYNNNEKLYVGLNNMLVKDLRLTKFQLLMNLGLSQYKGLLIYIAHTSKTESLNLFPIAMI